jgi:hypothetical protein
MHSHQRIGITSSRTTDTGVFFREDGKEWLGGGKENASRLSGTLQNSEEIIFCFFLLHHSLSMSAFFFFYLLFLFL